MLFTYNKQQMNSTRILKNKRLLSESIRQKDHQQLEPSLKYYPNLGFDLNDNPLTINFEKAFYETYDSPYNGFYKNAAPSEKPEEMVELISDRRMDRKSNSIGKYIEQQQFSHQPQVKQEEHNYEEQSIQSKQSKQKQNLKVQTFSASQQHNQFDKSQQQQQYVPESSSGKQAKVRRACQTKNITKNFGKAIISFILKNRQFTRKFCKQFNLEEKGFLRKVKSFQNRVATIKGLRQFWLQDSNTYAKYLRMLSILYLRKFSLQHIFNSRIQNYGINIKYRTKMIENITNPGQFTAIKKD